MRQKRLGKKIATWFLCLSMVLTIVNLPGFTKTVYAATKNRISYPYRACHGSEKCWLYH